jgi:hypothetical protein
MNNQNSTQLQESLLSQKTSSLPNAIELLKQSLNIYKQNLEAFLIIVLLLTIFGFIGMEYSNFITTSNISTIIGFIIFLINLIFTLWSFCAIIYLIDNYKKFDLTEAYRQTFKLIPSLLWLSFLGGFIILGSFVFLIIPGIVFGIWFIFAPYILVNENLKGMNALLKSKEYVRNYWWKIFWRVTVILILSFIINIPFSFLSFKKLILISEDVDQFINQLIWSFFYPLETIYIFIIYKNLQSIKGEFSFEPPKTQKLKYILVGVVGILIIAFIFLYFLISL